MGAAGGTGAAGVGVGLTVAVGAAGATVGAAAGADVKVAVLVPDEAVPAALAVLEPDAPPRPPRLIKRNLQ